MTANQFYSAKKIEDFRTESEEFILKHTNGFIMEAGKEYSWNLITRTRCEKNDCNVVPRQMFPERLMAFMTKYGMQVQYLVKELKKFAAFGNVAITERAVVNWLSLACTPNEATMLCLEHILGVSKEWLAGFGDNEVPEISEFIKMHIASYNAENKFVRYMPTVKSGHKKKYIKHATTQSLNKIYSVLGRHANQYMTTNQICNVLGMSYSKFSYYLKHYDCLKNLLDLRARGTYFINDLEAKEVAV